MVEISVIIPAYNVEDYIGDCVNSIINQTFKDIKIICVDDGLEDNTLKLLREFESKDDRIAVIALEHNGVGTARNAGLDAATGEYIYFMDSDDILDTNALTELYDIAKEKETDMIIFKSQSFNQDPSQPFVEEYNEMEQIPSSFKNKLFSFKDMLEHFTSLDVTMPTKFFKYDLIGDIRFDEDVIFEDNLFTIDYFFNANRIYFYDKVLYHRRLRPNSIITSTSKRNVEGLEVNNRMVKRIQDAGYYEDVKEKLFVKNFTKISYRFINIDDEYKEYFFDCLKKDLELNGDIIKNNLDFSLIDDRTTFIFENMMESSHFWELELRIRCYDYGIVIKKLKYLNEELMEENKKLKSELKKLPEG